MTKVEKIRGVHFMRELFEMYLRSLESKSSGANRACVNGKRTAGSIKELKQSASPKPF